MNKSIGLIALCASVLWLSACDKAQTTTPTPMVDTPVATESGVTAGSADDPSVPSAQSALSPATVTKAGPTIARSNGTMSEAQESAAMPMPGQNNDHSLPVGQPKRASAP